MYASCHVIYDETYGKCMKWIIPYDIIPCCKKSCWSSESMGTWSLFPQQTLHIYPHVPHIVVKSCEIHFHRKLGFWVSHIGAQGSPRSALQQRWKSSQLWTRLDWHCEQGFSILRAAWKIVGWMIGDGLMRSYFKSFFKMRCVRGLRLLKRKVEKKICSKKWKIMKTYEKSLVLPTLLLICFSKNSLRSTVGGILRNFQHPVSSRNPGILNMRNLLDDTRLINMILIFPTTFPHISLLGPTNLLSTNDTPSDEQAKAAARFNAWSASYKVAFRACLIIFSDGNILQHFAKSRNYM